MISIIIPAYNEEGNIKRIDSELTPVLKALKEEYEIIIVNDGSTDKTEEEARNLKDKNVRLVNHARNMNLGMAVRTGIKEARGNVIVMYEADFTWNPEYIKDLIRELHNGYDCVIGSHYHKEGKISYYNYRIFLSQAVNKMYQIILGEKISAMSSLFRAYRSEEIKKLNFTTTGFNINAEILIKMLRNNARVKEIPVTLTKRKFGVSKISVPKAILNHLKLLFSLLLWRMK